MDEIDISLGIETAPIAGDDEPDPHTRTSRTLGAHRGCSRADKLPCQVEDCGAGQM
jgi:hypothetical protein